MACLLCLCWSVPHAAPLKKDNSARCLTFDQAGWRLEQTQWKKKFDERIATDRVGLFDWLLGKTAPPDDVLNQVKAQARCMLIDLIKSTAVSRSMLKKIGFPEDHIGSTLRLARKRGKLSRSMMHHALLAHHRSRATQRYLWKKRSRFSAKFDDHIPRKTVEHCMKNQSLKYSACRRQLIIEKRELKALMGTAPPGISRHHWGTEIDLFVVNRYRFRDKGPLGPAYAWLKANAHRYGFFQPYLGLDDDGYIEERWHWSYSPISGPLMSVAKENEAHYLGLIRTYWNGLSEKWNRGRRRPIPYFRKVLERYHKLIFDIGPSWPPPESSKDPTPAREPVHGGP